MLAIHIRKYSRLLSCVSLVNSLYDWLGAVHYVWILHRSVDEMPMPDLGTTDQEVGEHLLIPLPDVQISLAVLRRKSHEVSTGRSAQVVRRDHSVPTTWSSRGGLSPCVCARRGPSLRPKRLYLGHTYRAPLKGCS